MSSQLVIGMGEVGSALAEVLDCPGRDTEPTNVEGYQELDDTRFTRPILDYVPGPIGGHCVTENAAHIDHTIARMVEDGWD